MTRSNPHVRCGSRCGEFAAIDTGTAGQGEPGEPLAAVLDDRDLGRRALSYSMSVETARDLPVLHAVQGAVLKLVARWQVAVEVNPSSNLLVGGFTSIFQQPAFHTGELPFTLNADDPLTFATTLADEYAYAWAGMVIGAGVSPHQATKRLEMAARCSAHYVFGPKSPWIPASVASTSLTVRCVARDSRGVVTVVTLAFPSVPVSRPWHLLEG